MLNLYKISFSRTFSSVSSKHIGLKADGSPFFFSYFGINTSLFFFRCLGKHLLFKHLWYVSLNGFVCLFKATFIATFGIPLVHHQQPPVPLSHRLHFYLGHHVPTQMSCAGKIAPPLSFLILQLRYHMRYASPHEFLFRLWYSFSKLFLFPSLISLLSFALATL